MLRGTRLGMNANPRRRRCASCQKLFLPEPRSRHCQRFCSQPACRKASKSASQAHWRSKPENRDYWRGPEHVERVRAWRKAHPQYWKPGVHSAESALQDDCRPPGDSPLQDDCIPDDPLLAGVIATLAGSTLQEDIAATCRRLIAMGCEILRRQTTAEAVASAPKPNNPA